MAMAEKEATEGRCPAFPCCKEANKSLRGDGRGNSVANNTCRDVWTEYHDIGFGRIKVVDEYKVYAAGEIVELLEYRTEASAMQTLPEGADKSLKEFLTEPGGSLSSSCTQLFLNKETRMGG
ncbi:Lecithin:cholesterol/phospholipid:diacylglycerol acyltransferase [Artemisia annua]|uniref:Lecithin:cholesterol/phospholipid:diacylglycerol acyltransferase n=1 Tax=Artemisia annua TaxID=35608 RepID=A0A2U1L1L2_ARTAN|nr:Lecithin:cholesterol/phospholipid:diacylglycerol acyltransferase [Artemisia annua]